MTDLQTQFQEETKLSIDGYSINGVHLEYIAWLESLVQALRIHNAVYESQRLPRITLLE